MRPVDIVHWNQVSSPSVAPDGTHAVVSVSHPDLGADAEVGQLWVVPLDRQAPPARRITRGFRDSGPQFSPDGRTIAFLRAGRTSAPQLALVPASGGEPIVITDRKLGVTEFGWTPDSRAIVFVSREPQAGRYGTVEGLEGAAEPPRRITTSRFRLNGLGYTIDKRAQLFALDVPQVDGEPVYEQAPALDADEAPAAVTAPKQLTRADADSVGPRVSPDGARLIFVSAQHDGRDDDLRRDLYAIRPQGGRAENLTAAHGSFSVHDAVWTSPERIVFAAQDLGESGLDFVGRGTALYALERGALTRLTDPETTSIASPLVGRADGSVLTLVEQRGTVQLVEVAASGGVRHLTAGPITVSGMGIAGDRIAVTFSAADTAGDVAIVEHGALRLVTDFSRELRASGIRMPQELVVPARDGESEVHGWVFLPEGEGPHPVLLNIHGGPFAQYTVSVFDEAQVYAAAGYAVVMCNPRGSAGYGQAHARAIRRAMGTVDLQDVLAFLDGAVDAHEQLDAERVGIMGGSYGGYLTAWTIAHDHRFAASIVERGFLDPEFFVGTSDIGAYFGQQYVGTEPKKVAAQSPQAAVGQVRTPTLVLHSEQDLRCPLSQAERYYHSLRANGVEAELLVFPGETHELTRSGRPRHRVQRFDAVLEWWKRHLPVTR